MYIETKETFVKLNPKIAIFTEPVGNKLQLSINSFGHIPFCIENNLFSYREASFIRYSIFSYLEETDVVTQKMIKTALVVFRSLSHIKSFSNIFFQVKLYEKAKQIEVEHGL